MGSTSGYQLVGGAKRALPIGSSLDRAAGLVSWEPPAGFYGPFALMFMAGTEQIDVTVTLVDGTRAPSPVAMNIDMPLDGSLVGGVLTIGGWALDPQAVAGSGIEAVHVWGVRRDVAASQPQFLGAATTGLARPDVAGTFGASFHDAGFLLAGPVLARGAYDITVYVRSRRTGQWDFARTVTVTAR